MTLEKKIEQISKELIFQKINSYDVYRFQIPEFKPRERISSPIRKDKNPSWGTFYADNELLWKDFATGESGNCITLIQRMYGLQYHEALEKIARDFGIIDGSEEYKRITSEYVVPKIDKRRSRIQVSTKQFTQQDIKYWQQFGISTEALKQERVWSINELYLNRRKVGIGKTELCYAYEYDTGFKIYFPYRKKLDKWLSSIPLDTPMHLENLSKEHNTLVVKSLKDYLVCKQVHPCCCYIQNETLGSVTEETARNIAQNSKEVYYGGDADIPGKQASYKITQKYSWKHINTPDILLPDVKDFADWRRLEGTMENIEKHFKKKQLIK